MPEIIDGIYQNAYMPESSIDMGSSNTVNGVNKNREIVYVVDWGNNGRLGEDVRPLDFTPAFQIEYEGVVYRRNLLTWEAAEESGLGGLRYLEDAVDSNDNFVVGTLRSKDPDSNRGALTGYIQGEFSYILGDYVKAEGDYGNFVAGYNTFIKNSVSNMSQSIGNYNVVDAHPQSGIFSGWNNTIGQYKVQFVVKQRVSAVPDISTNIYHDLFLVTTPFADGNYTFAIGDLAWWQEDGEGGYEFAKAAFALEQFNGPKLFEGQYAYSIDDEKYYQLSGGLIVEVSESSSIAYDGERSQFNAMIGGFQNSIFGDSTMGSFIAGGSQNKLGSSFVTEYLPVVNEFQTGDIINEYIILSDAISVDLVGFEVTLSGSNIAELPDQPWQVLDIIYNPIDSFNASMTLGDNTLTGVNASLYEVGQKINIVVGTGTLDSNLPAGIYTISEVDETGNTIKLEGVSAAGDGSGTCDIANNAVKLINTVLTPPVESVTATLTYYEPIINEFSTNNVINDTYIILDMPISDSYYRGMQVIVGNSDIPELPDGNATVYGIDTTTDTFTAPFNGSDGLPVADLSLYEAGQQINVVAGTGTLDSNLPAGIYTITEVDELFSVIRIQGFSAAGDGSGICGISNNAIKVSEFTPLTPGSGQTSKIRFIDLTKARYSAENGALIASDSKNLPVHYSSIIASEASIIDFDTLQTSSNARNNSILNSAYSIIHGHGPSWTSINSSLNSEIDTGPRVPSAFNGGEGSKLYQINNSNESSITGAMGYNLAIYNSGSSDIALGNNPDASLPGGPYYRGVSIHDSFNASINNHAFSSIRNSAESSITSQSSNPVPAAEAEGYNRIESSLNADIKGYVTFNSIENTYSSKIEGAGRDFTFFGLNTISYTSIKNSQFCEIYMISDFSTIESSSGDGFFNKSYISGIYTPDGHSAVSSQYSRIVSSYNTFIDKSGYALIQNSGDSYISEASAFSAIRNSRGVTSNGFNDGETIITGRALSAIIDGSYASKIKASNLTAINHSTKSSVEDDRFVDFVVSSISETFAPPLNIALPSPSNEPSFNANTNKSDIYFMIGGNGWGEEYPDSKNKQIAKWNGETDGNGFWEFLTLNPGDYVQYDSGFLSTFKFDKMAEMDIAQTISFNSDVDVGPPNDNIRFSDINDVDWEVGSEITFTKTDISDVLPLPLQENTTYKVQSISGQFVSFTYINEFNGLMPAGTGDLTVPDSSLYSVGDTVDISAGAGTLDSNLPDGTYTISAIVNPNTITLTGVTASGSGFGTCNIANLDTPIDIQSPSVNTFNCVMPVGTGDLTVPDSSLYSVGISVNISSSSGTLDSNLPAGAYTISAIVNSNTITLAGVSAAGDGVGNGGILIPRAGIINTTGIGRTDGNVWINFSDLSFGTANNFTLNQGNEISTANDSKILRAAYTSIDGGYQNELTDSMYSDIDNGNNNILNAINSLEETNIISYFSTSNTNGMFLRTETANFISVADEIVISGVVALDDLQQPYAPDSELYNGTFVVSGVLDDSVITFLLRETPLYVNERVDLTNAKITYRRIGNYNKISNGSFNTMSGYVNYSFLGTGGSNFLGFESPGNTNEEVEYASILNGTSNILTQTSNALIGSGFGNIISTEGLVSKSISGAVLIGIAVQITFSEAHGFSAGQQVVFSGIEIASVDADLYNGYQNIFSVVDDVTVQFLIYREPVGGYPVPPGIALTVEPTANASKKVLGKYNTILNAEISSITELSNYNAIVSGSQSTIIDVDYAFIGSGLQNRIISSDAASIVNGKLNLIRNEITEEYGELTSTMSNISGGALNSIVGVPFAHIGGGLGNNIIDYIAGSQASAIVSGLSNVIQGSGVPSFIGSGTFNMMGIVPLGTNGIDGNSLTVDTVNNFMNISGLLPYPLNYVPSVGDPVRFTANITVDGDPVEYLVYVDGEPATPDKIYYIHSFNGSDIALSTTLIPSVQADLSTPNSVFPAGNLVLSYAFTSSQADKDGLTGANDFRPISSAIVAGEYNYVRAAQAFIGAGSKNLISKAQYGIIVGGVNNDIINDFSLEGAQGTASFNTIIQGENHNIINSSSSTIIGGADNNVRSSDYSSIGINFTGTYDPLQSFYFPNDAVEYNGNNWVALNGAPQGQVPGASVSWTLITIGLYNTYSSAIVTASDSYIIGSSYSMIGGGVDIYLGKTRVSARTLLASPSSVMQTSHSTIAGGDTNTIFSSVYSFIGGGHENTIWGSLSTSSSIVSGMKNSIMGSGGSFIGAGYGNRISNIDSGTPTYQGVIIYNSDYIEIPYELMFDTENLLDVGDVVSLTLNSGTGSTDIVENFFYIVSEVFTVGGFLAPATQVRLSYVDEVNLTLQNVTFNDLGTNASYSITFNTTNEYSSILSGNSNLVTSGNSFIGTGYNNNISIDSTYSSIVSAAESIISKSSESFIGAGYGNVISNTSVSNIIGGEFNFIGNDAFDGNGQASGHSSIVGGDRNRIQGGARNHFIGGGDSNIILNPSNTGITFGYSSIVGGLGNIIDSSGSFQFIGGGFQNTIKSPDATIAGGIGNLIVDGSKPEASSGGIIGAGIRNTLVGASAGGIFAGTSNVIVDDAATSNNSVIVGGFENIISAASGRNSILAGTNNNIGVLDISYLDKTDIDIATDTISVSIPNDTEIRIVGGIAADSSTIILEIDNIPVTADRTFYIVNDTGTTVQLSNTIGGAVLDINETNTVNPYSFTIATVDSLGYIAENSTIVSGENNSVNAQSSGIVSGIENFINQLSSGILAGKGNTIQTLISSYAGGYNGIGAGVNNTILLTNVQSNSCFISAGEGNLIGGDAQSYSSISSGYANEILAGSRNFIAAGNVNRIVKSEIPSISTGAARGNAILSSDANDGLASIYDRNSTPTTLSGNEIVGEVLGSFIGAGAANRLSYNVNHSAISSGVSNTIVKNATSSFIGAGEKNTIGSSSASITATGLDGLGNINIPVEYMYEGAINPNDLVTITGSTDVVAGQVYVTTAVNYVDSTTATISIGDPFLPVNGNFTNISITNDTGIVVTLVTSGADSSAILAGFNNTTYSSETAIVNGTSNIISSNAGNSVIMGGLANYLSSGDGTASSLPSGESAIIAGNSNVIQSSGISISLGSVGSVIKGSTFNSDPGALVSQSNAVITEDALQCTIFGTGGSGVGSPPTAKNTKYTLVAASAGVEIEGKATDDTINHSVVLGSTGVTISDSITPTSSLKSYQMVASSAGITIDSSQFSTIMSSNGASILNESVFSAIIGNNQGATINSLENTVVLGNPNTTSTPINADNTVYMHNLVTSGNVINLSGIPTSDPGVSGQLWNDSGTLKISP